MIKVNKSKCLQNQKCPMVGSCPQGAISQEGFSLPKVSVGMCVECLDCVKGCPVGAFYQTVG
ncbi:MAG: ferredoxin [Methermicoccaceae archaeon]